MSVMLAEISIIHKVMKAYNDFNKNNYSCEQLDLIANEIIKINNHAYSKRYNDNNIDDVKFIYKNKPYSDIEKYKALQFILYNWSDDNLNSKLFNELEIIKNNLAHDIVCNLLTYKTLPWGE